MLPAGDLYRYVTELKLGGNETQRKVYNAAMEAADRLFIPFNKPLVMASQAYVPSREGSSKLPVLSQDGWRTLTGINEVGRPSGINEVCVPRTGSERGGSCGQH